MHKRGDKTSVPGVPRTLEEQAPSPDSTTLSAGIRGSQRGPRISGPLDGDWASELQGRGLLGAGTPSLILKTSKDHLDGGTMFKALHWGPPNPSVPRKKSDSCIHFKRRHI